MISALIVIGVALLATGQLMIRRGKKMQSQIDRVQHDVDMFVKSHHGQLMTPELWKELREIANGLDGNNMKTKLIASAVLFGALAFTAFPCAAQFAVVCTTAAGGPCAGEPVQILNKIALAAQLIKQTLLLEDAIKNTVQQKGLPASGLAYDLVALGQIMQYGQGLAYSAANVDKQFRTVYPGYTGVTPGGGTFYQNYNAWTRASLDTMSGVMALSNLSHGHSMNAAQAINVLQTLISTVDGRLKAMQVSAVMAQRQAESLEQLHALMLADVNSKQAYQGFQVQKDVAAAQGTQQFFNYSRPVSDHYAPPATIVGP